MLDSDKTYHLEIVILNPADIDILNDKINQLQSELIRITAERDKLAACMSEYATIKLKLGRAKKLLRKLGVDPSSYNI